MSEEGIVEFNDRAARVGVWRRIDAVVFVHGIAGHFHDTWGAFPELLRSDPDLPDLDILLWGYRTGYLRQDVHGTRTLAHHFISELDLRLDEGAVACIVAHSMGGLIVFRGLVDEMDHGRAQEHPTRSIRFISLFSVPTKGSSAAGVATTAIEWLGLPEGILNEQIRSLGGEACDSLISSVVGHIHDPPTEGPNARRIPIRMVVASRDSVVDPEDRDMANVPFQDPAPLELDYGHGDVKLPSSHEDVRYLALARDVQVVVAERFVEVCRRCLHGIDEDRRNAEIDLDIRYGRLLRQRFTAAGGRPENERDLYDAYLELVKHDCVSHNRPPFDSANRAVIALRSHGHLGRAS